LKPALVIIDDMGLKALPKQSGEYLLEVIMRRYENRSTIMTSNRPLEDWGKLLNDVPTAGANWSGSSSSISTQTPSAWPRELRCRVARELLEKGWRNKAVAVELNFASDSHLCHEFRRMYGVPPRTFAPTYRDLQNVAFLQGCRVFTIPPCCTLLTFVLFEGHDRDKSLYSP